SQAITSAVTYNIATGTGGTATAGSDFVAKSLVGETIPAGQTSKTFAVTINGDTTIEANEGFAVNLSAPTNATLADSQGTGTITNDDKPTLAINDVAIAEGNSGTKLLTFTVTQSAAAPSAVSYNIATGSGGTATAG